MADISFSCPQCQQPLEAPQEYASQDIECPACHNVITVPALEAATAGNVVEPDPPKVNEPAGSKCPECDAALGNGAVLCMQCGFHLKLGKKIATDFK